MNKQRAFLLSLLIAVTGLFIVGMILHRPSDPAHAASAITVCLDDPGCDYDSIQAAVDAAPPSWEIWVAAGTYDDVHMRNGVTQVVYISKTITIIGGYTSAFTGSPDCDANPTIIDAQGLGRGVYIQGSSIYAHLASLHIRGGDATGLLGGPWPGYDVGGGVVMAKTNGMIENCRIYDNIASRTRWGGGGGVYIWNDTGMVSIIIEDTLITENIASAAIGDMGEGGGIALSGVDAVIMNNEISWNTSSLVAPESALWGSEGLGGGIYTEMCGGWFRNNIIHHNIASAMGDGGGGAVWFGLGDTTNFLNNVIVSNAAGPATGSLGSAIAVEWSNPTFDHTTIHSNLAGGWRDEAVSVFSGSAITLNNTILVSQTQGIWVESGDSATIDGVLWYDVGTTIVPGSPVVVTNEITGTPNFAEDGYHLRPGSWAIDAGVTPSVSNDIDGDVRPIGSAPDLGADEWRPSVTLTPGVSATLVYTYPLVGPITVTIPAGAVVETTTLVLNPLHSPGSPSLPSGVIFLNQAFDLGALCLADEYAVYLPVVMRSAMSATSEGQSTSGAGAPIQSMRPLAVCVEPSVPCTLTFSKPVTVTAWYDPSSVTDLNTVTLYMLDGTQWIDAATTCSPTSTYFRHPTLPVISVEICHLTRFAIGGR